MNNIIIRGARNVGKTTLINSILCDNNIDKYYGFRTRKEVDGINQNKIFIHDVTKDEAFLESNMVGSCKDMLHITHTDIFETTGVNILSDIPSRSVVIMDEIGFMEKDAYKFQDKIITLMDSDSLIIAAIKDKSTSFLDKVAKNENNIIFDINISNRNILKDKINEQIKRLLYEIKEAK